MQRLELGVQISLRARRRADLSRLRRRVKNNTHAFRQSRVSTTSRRDGRARESFISAIRALDRPRLPLPRDRRFRLAPRASVARVSRARRSLARLARTHRARRLDDRGRHRGGVGANGRDLRGSAVDAPRFVRRRRRFARARTRRKRGDSRCDDARGGGGRGREMVASASAGAKSSPVMNALTETLARATLVGGAFPPKARAPDFPLVTSFYLERAPDDAALETFARAVGVVSSSGVERRRRTRGARRRFGGCVGSAWTMEGG